MINNLSIILPVYNEEIRLQENLKKIKKFFSYKKIKKKEFIFVDDGSTDNTANIIRTFISNNSKKKLIRLIVDANDNSSLCGFENQICKYSIE